MLATITFRARWLPWVLAGLAVLQLLLPSRVWIGLLVALGGLWLMAYLWARHLAARLQVTREQHYGWVHVGDLLEERFVMVNGSFLPALWVEIDDASDLPGYSARSVRSADGYATVGWRTEGICRQRGLFTLGPWRACTGDPLGLYSITFDHPAAQSVLVYPPIVHLPTLCLPRGAATGSGRASRRALDVTVNAAGVRPYVPGDAVNRIHWPTTARRDALAVKTFDLEPSGDLWIVLDMDQAVHVGEGEESTEEYGVILAASLSNRTLEENRAVGLVAYGTVATPTGEPQPLPTLVVPGKGRAQQWRILEALATVRAGGRWPLARVLVEMNRNLGRGTTLAVITPSCDPGWVAGLLPPMRRGVTPTVLLLDPNTFGGSGNVEAMATLLAELGIHAEQIVQGTAFRPIVEHERIGRPELKVLSGTGRVIKVTSGRG
ncbi:MAG: DUF58 domain-containing protein [Anaerolineae bacterium]|nr:DUF58 domain-containing protein [Anaerolineae bacterium]